LFELILESENFALEISLDLGECRLALLFRLRTGGQRGAQLAKFAFEARARLFELTGTRCFELPVGAIPAPRRARAGRRRHCGSVPVR
jgi:hypothetical protein